MYVVLHVVVKLEYMYICKHTNVLKILYEYIFIFFDSESSVDN